MPERPEYQGRPSWIAEEAWSRGYIEAFELARIGAWKSARSVAAITVNKAEEIEAWTRAAISAIRPWQDRRAAAFATDADWAAWRTTANLAIGWMGSQGEPRP